MMERKNEQSCTVKNETVQQDKPVPELLAPAGSLFKLKVAILYGADAVYCAGKAFGLRAAAENLTFEELEEGVRFAHARGKKIYQTLNVIPRQDDLKHLPQFIEQSARTGIDAFIVSDPGVFTLVQQYAPETEIHISTQAKMCIRDSICDVPFLDKIVALFHTVERRNLT